jgi:hypothetical protein
MAHTRHGHWIPGSTINEFDDRSIRLAKKCGGVTNCGDCIAEVDQYAQDELQMRGEYSEEVKAAMSRHPSKTKFPEPRIRHEYLDLMGNMVTAWQVQHVIEYYGKQKRFPVIFESVDDVFEVDLLGKTLRKKSDEDPRDFTVLRSTNWIVFFGGGRGARIFDLSNFNELFQSYEEDAEELEAVNHPAHYGGADNPYEVIKVIEAWELDFHLGTAVKYIPRAGKKDPQKEIEDLEKSVFYIQRKIDLLRKAENDAAQG